MDKIRILGMYVSNRMKEATRLQEVMTEYGCYIKTRLGLHEVTEDFCSSTGLIILELFGDLEKQEGLEKSLKEIEGIEVQKMVFQK